MDDRLHLHDGERLLLSIRPSTARLIVDLLRGAGEAAVASVLVLGLLAAVSAFVVENSLSPWIYGALAIVILAGLLYRRWRHWRHSLLRVTTERILIHHHHGLFAQPMHTIRWEQYQESAFGKRGIFDVFFRVRPLCIRYGTADAHNQICFPSLPYAEDIKHYLDKVYSAVRRKQEDALRPFVTAPRGQRDVMTS